MDYTVIYQKSMQVNKHIFSVDNNYMYLDFFFLNQILPKDTYKICWKWTVSLNLQFKNNSNGEMSCFVTLKMKN